MDITREFLDCELTLYMIVTHLDEWANGKEVDKAQLAKDVKDLQQAVQVLQCIREEIQ